MQKNHLDTYFISATDALKEAKKQNKVQLHKTLTGTQVCYYAGEKLKKTPSNCINVPLENIFNYFRDTENRKPETISYKNTNYDKIQRDTLTTKIIQTINQAFLAQDKLIREYKEKIKKNKPNFKEKKWRIFIPTSTSTSVMQHVSKHIATTFESMGYKVLFFIEKNDLQYPSLLAQVKAHYEFNPHITINLNHFNNTYLHKEVCNIIWIQDPMTSLVDKQSEVVVRPRDIIYSLAKPLDYYLENKKVPFTRQNFAINRNIYKKYKKVKREKKIVFVGSSYLANLNENTPTALLDEILQMFKRGLDFDEDTVQRLALKYNQDFSYLNTRVITFIIRDFSIMELCKIETDYQVEIYGWGWERYPEVKPFYKGVLKYGKEIAKVFNSATYSLSPHSGSLIQQRVLESSACGCISIVYDCKVMDSPPFYSKNLIFYKQLSSLTKILKSSPSRKLKRLVKKNSYEKLAKRIIREVTKII